MKLENLVFIEDRVKEGSSQVYMHLDMAEDEFYTPIANDGCVMGYWKFKKVKEGCFQLVSLESLDYPNPYPQFSLSGVLYSRKEALLSHQLMSSYEQGLGQQAKPIDTRFTGMLATFLSLR